MASDLEKVKADYKRQAGRTLISIEEAAPETLTYLRVGDPRLIQKALTNRLTDLRNQMENNKDLSTHLDLVGRIVQIKELIALFHYVRM